MAHKQTQPSQSHVGTRAKSKLDRKIDDTVEDSFPASDPPSYAGGSHRAGAPKPQRTHSSGRKTNA